ncbi:MAG: helix-turn-helix transcriptional regulator [Legionellaceae bacterium]|nr:helix-turn-helix transcriptional regulator [Legionellaceae bacterium]
MKTSIQSTQDIGYMIRSTRKQLGVTQSDLALAAGTGLRFIIELEKGKPTCQIGKILDILQVLNIQCNLSHPEGNSLGS